LPELGISGRIGVNTGEVLAGTSERLATGDAVNVAARFEQAAAPGEVLTRAVELLRPLRFDLALELEAATAKDWVDVHAAAQAADAVAERAEAEGDRSGAMLARAMALLLRTVIGGLRATDEQESLCRAALPLEDERGDPRRLALLWELIAFAAVFRMRNDDAVDAFEQVLSYRRLAGDSPSAEQLDWSLILGSRPADDGLRMLGELAAGRPPGDADLARAAMLALLGRIDEAWALAEARSAHLREMGSGWYAGEQYLALIAMIEGDRQRACRHYAELIDALPPGSDGVAASYKLALARELCYLGRFEEASPSYARPRPSRRARSSGLGDPPWRRSSSPSATSSSRRRLLRALASPSRSPRRTA
jgi:tetratricopeptide (TPR) repeat protein